MKPSRLYILLSTDSFSAAQKRVFHSSRWCGVTPMTFYDCGSSYMQNIIHNIHAINRTLQTVLRLCSFLFYGKSKTTRFSYLHTLKNNKKKNQSEIFHHEPSSSSTACEMFGFHGLSMRYYYTYMFTRVKVRILFTRWEGVISTRDFFLSSFR